MRRAFSRLRSSMNARKEAAERSGATKSRREVGRPELETRRLVLDSPLVAVVDVVVVRRPSAQGPHLDVADASARTSRAALAASLCRRAIRDTSRTSSSAGVGGSWSLSSNSRVRLLNCRLSRSAPR